MPSRPAPLVVAVLLAILIMTPVSYAVMLRTQDPVAVPIAVQDTAVTKYSLPSQSSMQVTAAEDPGFAAAFPDLDLYVVFETHKWYPFPAHVLAWDPAAEVGFDVTTEFNPLLDHENIAVLTAADALLYAEAFVKAANPEVQLTRMLVDASDGSWLDAPVEDPSTTSTLTGWKVTLTTWARENGILADWTVRFQMGDLERATWTVRDVLVGPYDAALGGMNLHPQNTMVNSFDNGHSFSATETPSAGSESLVFRDVVETLGFPTLVTATTFDGSQWQAGYPSGTPIETHVSELAERLVKAGADAYDTMVSRSKHQNEDCGGTWNPDDQNWSFEADDPDCILDIHIIPQRTVRVCGICVVRLDGCETTVLVRDDLYDWLQNANGWYTNATIHNNSTIAATLMGHEWFHALQCGILYTDDDGDSMQPTWTTLLEGQARAVQTLYAPTVEHDATSQQYWRHQDDLGCPPLECGGPYDDGMNDYVTDTNHSLDRQGYASALLWGFAASRNGGTAFLQETLHQIRHAESSSNGETITETVAAAIDDALKSGNLSTTDPDLTSLMDNLTLALVDGGFSWSGKQWGDHLESVRESRISGYASSEGNGQELAVGGWGIQIVRIDLGTTSFDLRCDVGSGSWNIRVVAHDPSAGSTSIRGPCDATFQQPTLAPSEQAFVVAVRTEKGDGEVAVEVAPA